MTDHEQGGPQRRLRQGNLEWREVEGEIVALDLDASVYLRANAAGALLWDALGEGATEEELVERLAARYRRLPPDTAAADVRAFLAALESHSLLAP